MKRRASQLLSILLVLCMLLGLWPSMAFAASYPFTDVSDTAWYSDAVQYVYERGLMIGTSSTHFSPDEPTTRGMIVTILHRIDGTPPASGDAFKDVPSGEWYSDAVTWASANGIVNGYGDGTFGPDDTITREDMTLILYQYADFKGYDTTITGSAANFSDWEQLDSYATDAVNWAIGARVLQGSDDNTLSPTGAVTRAVAATILMRFCETIDKLTVFTVTFDSQGGSPVGSKSVLVNSTLSEPDEPVRDGYIFDGWYFDQEQKDYFLFDIDTIDEDITLYAGWREDEKSSDGSVTFDAAMLFENTPENGSKEETLSFTETNPDSAITGAKVNYKLNSDEGFVDIADVSTSSYMGHAAGAVGSPIDICAINGDVEVAELIFTYDESKLDGVDPKNLGIVWYDEENQIAKLVDDTVVDLDAHTITAKLSHFSEYVAVDKSIWYDVWAEEQLVVRGDDEDSKTPYYNVIFALDNSGSMSGNKITLLKSATEAFIKLLKDKDMWSVVYFSDDANVISKFEYGFAPNTPEAIINYSLSGLRGIQANGGTNFQAGLSTALSLIIEAQEQEENKTSDGIARQCLLVFLSDGDPTTNYTQETLEMLRYLSETVGCRCVTVGLGSGVNSRYLVEMANAGNGAYRFISSESDLPGLFEEINGWYVGSTKDSDGDGIPDIVETTGMRSSIGEVFRTDPNNPDTDGDGISDGEEMGRFEYRDGGGSYFIINSRPTTPTFRSPQSKLTVTGESWKIVLNRSESSLKNLSFEEINNLVKKYKVTYHLRAEKLELAWDFLSETLYSDAVYDAVLSFQEGGGASDRNKPLIAGTETWASLETSCANGLLSCKNSHTYDLTITNHNGTCTKGKYTIPNPKQEIQGLWQRIINNVTADYAKQQSKMNTKGKAIVKKIDKAYNDAKEAQTEKLNKKIERQLLIDPQLKAYEPEVYKAFVDLFTNDFINTAKPSDFKGIKTGAELVNRVAKSLIDDDDVITFVAGGKTYSATYKPMGTTLFGGAKYFSGKIKTDRNPNGYDYGGTDINPEGIEQEMNNLKEFAEERIEKIKEAAYDDIKDIIWPGKLKDLFKAVPGDKTFPLLEMFLPNLADTCKTGLVMATSYLALEAAHDDLLNIDLDDAEPGDIFDKIDDYIRDFDNWTIAVNGFIP